jgi:hypothetical protein
MIENPMTRLVTAKSISNFGKKIFEPGEEHKNTKGQAQRLTDTVDLVSFADRWVCVGDSFWRLQDDDFEISVGGYGRNALVPHHF